MKRMKDSIEFDRDRAMQDLSKGLQRTMSKVGNKFMTEMRRNLRELNLMPLEWRQEVVAALDKRFIELTEDAITMVAGILDADESSFFMIRAMVLEHGVGSKGDAGRPAVWHKQGIPGLNDDITGYNTSDAESFALPEKFNHPPGRWFRDASTKMDEIFDDEIQSFFDSFNPLDYMYTKKG